MFSKWKIKGIENYVFGEDKKLYKLPYVENKRAYGLREIKKQYPNRYKINGNWLSERQIKSRLYLAPNPIELITEKDLPF